MPSVLSQLGTITKSYVDDATANLDVTSGVQAANRGTASPHLGAHPHQPFDAIHNVDRSAFAYIKNRKMYICTDTGPLPVPAGLAVNEDSAEPDVEMVTDAGNVISAISGDLDRRDPYGNPLRPGYRSLDLGANQTPPVITGGTVDGAPFPDVPRQLKLQRKDFLLSPSMVGTSSDVSWFKRQAIVGQELFCTDTKDLYKAETSADGTTPATLSKFTPAATGL